MTTTEHCKGCRDDFYNGRQNICGNTCWSLKSAVMEKRIIVPVDMRPPYLHLPVQNVLNCYRPERCVSVKPENLTTDGYWRR